MIPPRQDVKAALRATGMSVRQVDALLRQGWSTLVGVEQAEIADLQERLERVASHASLEQSERES